MLNSPVLHLNWVAARGANMVCPWRIRDRAVRLMPIHPGSPRNSLGMNVIRARGL
jgi:hypothetical protein